MSSPIPSRAQRGLPVGSGGKGLLLLSGGIDSPVAGYMMARAAWPWRPLFPRLSLHVAGGPGQGA